MMKNPAANIRSGKLLACVRLGRSAETISMDLGGWPDLYTFGGALSRIDQATDRRDSPYDHSHANPIEVARRYYVLAWPDSGAPKEPSLYLSILDSA
jgi:hypothetical protein